MAHERRAVWAQELATKIPAEIVWDRGLDTPEASEWDTGARALGKAGAAPWHVVVQDDAILCDGFAHHTRRLLNALKPTQPVCFYIGNLPSHANRVQPALDYAIREEASLLEMPGPWWGVAIAVPTRHIPALLARSTSLEYDKRIGTFYKRQGVECWYPVPSMVDHRHGPSLFPGRRPERFALHFTGKAPTDWTKRVHLHTKFRRDDGRILTVRPSHIERVKANPRYVLIEG